MHHPTTHALRRGFTLTEVVMVLGVIGILTAVAIPSYSGLFGSSQATLASGMLETLNTGLHRFNEVNYELLYPAQDGTITDELAVLRTLQYRNPSNPAIGSPYVKNNWSPLSSANTNDYRIVWTGSLFKLLTPGQTGTGMKVAFDGSDQKKPYAFPANFSMAGK